MFDLFGTQRLNAWKQFRTEIENSETPLEDVAEFWSHAPFVSPYLDPGNPTIWPDPWHLILDAKYDDLAIPLGMLYTLKLTQRFMGSKFEIHMSIPDNKDKQYMLIVDDKQVLNFEYKAVIDIEKLKNIQTTLIWSSLNSL